MNDIFSKKCFIFLKIVVILILSFSNSLAESNNYYGSVAINIPAEIGNIDIAFHLETDDSTGAIYGGQQSFIIWDKTLLFPKTGQIIDGTETINIGPKVQSGYLTPSDFYLVTEPFQSTVSGRTVDRQITLDGAPDPKQGNMIIGTYTETLTGYLPATIIVTGDFILVHPISVTGEALTADLHGVILALQVCAGLDVDVNRYTDLGGNNKIGIEDAIMALQIVAGIRTNP